MPLPLPPLTTADPESAANIALALLALAINPRPAGFNRSASRIHRDSLAGDLRLCSPLHAGFVVSYPSDLDGCRYVVIRLHAPGFVNHNAIWTAWIENADTDQPAHFYWEG